MALTREILEERQETLLEELRQTVEKLRMIEGALQQIRWDLDHVSLTPVIPITTGPTKEA